MKINTDQQRINGILTRGVENIYPKKEFLEARLKEGKQLTLYTGYDPTAPTLHIGHAITMMKLRQFQDLGHRVIMLIGDFTGMIGDPTDKTSARQQLTRKQVLTNCKNYKKQASSILNFKGKNAVEVKYNSKWLGKMSFSDVLDLASHFTVQQMLERDMFRKRNLVGDEYTCPECGVIQRVAWAKYETGTKEDISNACIHGTNIFSRPSQPVYIHEFLYPLMQAYDSVAMNIDGEVGGNDQMFNMLVGRDLLKELKNKEKFVLTLKLLTDVSGKKMGKSEGNMIALSDKAEDMYGKVMNWTDGMIRDGFELCTRAAVPFGGDIKADPMKYKKMLALEVVKTFLGEKEANKAAEYFVSTFSKKEIPTEIQEIRPSVYDVSTVLVESKICGSKGEARRNIDQGGVKINEQKVAVGDYGCRVQSGDVVQKGSRFFVRVV